jgi:uncharacterized protein (TIGR03083 family)
VDTSDAVGQEILDLADRLALLDDEQWNSASLCEGWRVRDVIAHVVAGAEGAFGVGAIVGGLVRYRFDYNRWVAVDGQSRGRQDPALILQRLRAAATYRNGRAADQSTRALTHVVIHGQDVCRPLGITRDLPEAHLLAVADFVATSIIFRAQKRIAGIKLVASDIPWSRGKGPEVTGPAEALVMTMAGRASALDQLSGEGIDDLHQAFRP